LQRCRDRWMAYAVQRHARRIAEIAADKARNVRP
jgi:hypothetical protein